MPTRQIGSASPYSNRVCVSPDGILLYATDNSLYSTSLHDITDSCLPTDTASSLVRPLASLPFQIQNVAFQPLIGATAAIDLFGNACVVTAGQLQSFYAPPPSISVPSHSSVDLSSTLLVAAHGASHRVSIFDLSSAATSGSAKPISEYVAAAMPTAVRMADESVFYLAEHGYLVVIDCRAGPSPELRTQVSSSMLGSLDVCGDALAAAGADRSVHVYDRRMWRALSTSAAAMKYEIRRVRMPSASEAVIAGVDSEMALVKVGQMLRGRLMADHVHADATWIGMDVWKGRTGSTQAPAEEGMVEEEYEAVGVAESGRVMRVSASELRRRETTTLKRSAPES